MFNIYGLWGEGLVWLIGAVVCLLAIGGFRGGKGAMASSKMPKLPFLPSICSAFLKLN